MDARRVNVDVRQQGLMGLAGVALGVVRRDEALVTPPEVHLGPVDGGRRRRFGHGLERADAHRAPGKHHRGLAVPVLDVHQLGDQAGRDGSHQDGRVRMDAYSRVSAHWDGHSLDWYVAVQ